MALGERIALALRAGGLGEDDLDVSAVEGREGLSEPFAFEVSFRPVSGEPLDLASFAGQEAVLSLRRPTGEERWVHGECVRAGLAGVDSGKPRYRLLIAPRLLRLANVAQNRIFQEKSVPDVVKEVLDEHGVEHELSLSGSYPALEYVVQYRETDLAFVARLLAEQGIWYRFQHGDGAHTLVLADAAGALEETNGPVPLRPGGEQGDGSEHLARLERVYAVASGKATRRDFDFEKPDLDLTAPAGQEELEVYEYPGGYRAPADGKRLAAARLEGLRYGVESFRGSGNALAFRPGAKVELEDGPGLAVVRVVHRAAQVKEAGAVGELGTRYANEFEAIDAGRPYRPRPGPPRPRMGVQTATVTGPSGEEIHVDAHGRIKVQLHWDRDGKHDDRTSCWMRVAQAWAGAGMGASYVPRIGQEVVVRYLEGDPDRPLVTGAVFNGSNPPPVDLPGERTRSLRRTNTSAGGGGFNELVFEDQADAEELDFHAQKDWNTVVKADRTERVGVDAALAVAKDRTKVVMGSQRLMVSGADASQVDGNQTVTVAAGRRTVVAVSHSEAVAGSQAVTVAGSRTVGVAVASADTVGAAAALTIGGGYAVSVGGALNHAVGGLKATQVAGAMVEVVGAGRSEDVGKNKASRTQGDLAVQVKGSVTVKIGKDAAEDVDGKVELSLPEGVVILSQAGTLQADKLTIVVGGKKALVLEKSGAVKLAGGAVTLDASGALKLKGAQAKMVAGAAAASGSAKVAELADLDPAKKVAKVSFKDKKGKAALAGVKFKLKTPAGDKKGAVDGSGVISVGDLKPGKCELELTGLDED